MDCRKPGEAGGHDPHRGHLTRPVRLSLLTPYCPPTCLPALPIPPGKLKARQEAMDLAEAT